MIKLTNIYETIVNNLTFETFEDEDRITISAFLGKKNVGYVILERIVSGYWMFEDIMSEDDYYEIFPDDEFVQIEVIKVFDDYQDVGYGKELMKKAIELSKSMGYNRIYLNASPMGNRGLKISELVSFYKKFGFNIIPQTDNWTHNKEMVLKL